MTNFMKGEGVPCCKCGVDDALIRIGDYGYYIECLVCGRRTKSFKDLRDAIWQWALQSYEGE